MKRLQTIPFHAPFHHADRAVHRPFRDRHAVIESA